MLLVDAQRRTGARFEVCDDFDRQVPVIGMLDVYSGARYEIEVHRLKWALAWGMAAPPPSFTELLKTPTGRRKLAWVLSVGDHCLDLA